MNIKKETILGFTTFELALLVGIAVVLILFQGIVFAIIWSFTVAWLMEVFNKKTKWYPNIIDKIDRFIYEAAAKKENRK